MVFLCFAVESRPQTLVLEKAVLEQNRAATAKDARLSGALKGLRDQADRLAKKARVYSVIDKQQVPPSGDKHDYMSQAPYWWPDPAKPNGLPYIRRDGERNPELNKISDAAAMNDMVSDAETLAVAYYFTADERYAKHAAALIRTWFLDAKTRQNPNLNFAQGIPGISAGRGIGLIETRDLYRVIDASILIENSPSWAASDLTGLKQWFADFLKWMTTSPLGIDEADERNNHGTYYDVQILAYAIYTGQKDLARKQLNVSRSRIKSQIEPDGRQPHELARTLSWNYTNMNLYGFFMIARLAENVGEDLWNFEADGRGVRRAFEWTLPFVREEKKWTYQQIKDRNFGITLPILRIASRKFKQPDYIRLADTIAAKYGANHLHALTH